MKPIGRMNQGELAAYVQTGLRERGIETILSGGAAVALYSRNKYVSLDLDLVNAYFAKPAHIRGVMEQIGFYEVGRHFKHPESRYIIEFPPGPLSVGGEPVTRIDELKFSVGTLRVISPTDCVKDRLAAYYHWGDQQCLIQAILVSKESDVDLEEIQRWSISEDWIEQFNKIRKKLIGVEDT
jgi:hypothetical protein